jgi:hypothetical protein
MIVASAKRTIIATAFVEVRAKIASSASRSLFVASGLGRLSFVASIAIQTSTATAEKNMSSSMVD